MLAYCTGDVRAFELLYKRYKDSLYAYFLRSTDNKAVAGELFQDVWMRLIQSRDKYQDNALFSSWLFRIAHNRLIDHYRYRSKRKHDDQLQHEFVSTIASPLQPQEIISCSQDRQRLNKAIQKLPSAQRDVLIMRMEWQLNLEEIANIVGEPRETVKSRLRYAGNKLRMYLRSRE